MNKVHHPLIEMLESMAARDDRAALAELRKGLSPGRESAVYPFVARFFPMDSRPSDERSLVTVAALFALHPVSGTRSIAFALRSIRLETDSDSVEKRFVGLLDSHVEDLPNHLRHAVSLCRSHDRTFDWSGILDALRNWEHEDRWVQRRWARDFWSTERSEQSTREQENA
ncbi:MAG TPA: type I-E CRISPR-associated protein Cse2/CasB [Vulgatibacter sp.]|nr:type I-E CRISPR-associated protein Cse2/CasB [Vulgatibacter sp.]